MKRRRFIIGTGALAAGGAAAIGTGAYSAAEMDRDANINVVADPDGLVALDPGDEGGVVGLNDGELYIDFNPEDEGTGVNVNSRYIVGSFHHVHIGNGADQIDPDHVFDSGANTIHSTTMGSWGYAFRVINQSTEDRDITLSFEAEDNPFNGYLGFGLERPFGQREAIEIEDGTVAGSAEFTDVPPGEAVYVSFVVSTIDAGVPGDDLGGTLAVEAE